MLCCALTILVNKIQIHTKDESEKYEETSDNNEAQYNKTVKLTIDMCKLLYGTRVTVNMDNYYMSAATAIKLREHSFFCCGTIRSMRKRLPKSVLFTPTEAKQQPRGHSLCAVNRENNLITKGWLDNKPIIFISTADTTEIVQVMRRIRNKKVLIPAPVIWLVWVCF